jgi:hypothetical protein
MISMLWATFHMHDGNKFDILTARSRHAYPLRNGTRQARNRHNGASGCANRAHASAPDAGELGRSQDAGSELAGKHTRVGRAPDTRMRRHHARCCGSLAPTSPPSADCTFGGWLRRIWSASEADEAPAKGERLGMKRKVSDRRVQVGILPWWTVD